MEHIFELRMKDQIEERSSQLLRNLSSCEKKARKKGFLFATVFSKTSTILYVSFALRPYISLHFKIQALFK